MSIASPITTTALAATLRAVIDGDVVTPDDPGFPAAGFGFSDTARRRAEVIVIAARASDVAAAVRVAARAGRRVAIQLPGRTGGDGEVMIVTRLLAGVSVDPLTRTATVGVAAGWTQVLDAAEPHGLFAVAAGSGFDDVGRLPSVARLPLFASARVLALQVATAAGDLVWVDAADDPDLFSDLRAGGGSLGFVTAMTIDLLPSPSLLAGELWLASGPEALQAWRNWATSLPAHASTSVTAGTLPSAATGVGGSAGAPSLVGRFAHVGEPADVFRLVARLRQTADVLLETVSAAPWSTVTAGLRAAQLRGTAARPAGRTVDAADRDPALIG